jgi:hypothetical protein
VKRQRNNSASVATEARVGAATLAARFGITEDALSEIGDTVAEELNSRAFELASQQRETRKMRPAPGNDRWPAHFGVALHPLFVRAFESYVELLTKTILAHGRSTRPVGQESIIEQALQFCRGFEDLSQSGPWLSITGPSGAQIGPSECDAFLTSLSRWTLGWEPSEYRFQNVRKRGARIIKHAVRLAPERKPMRQDWPQRSREELKKLESLSRKDAAMELCCKGRTLRYCLQKKQLDQTKAKRILLNQKFWHLYDTKHSP